MQVFDSNEKIGIYYFYPDGVPAGAGALHAGVFYSRVELGIRVTTTFDAGPANRNVSGIDGASEVAKELAGIRDPATPYGKMTMKSTDIDGIDSRDMRLPDGIVGANILASGENLFQSFQAIERTFTQAGSGLYYYFPWLQNSNTVAREALAAGGITWTPAYPDSAILFIPGTGPAAIGTGGARPTMMQPFGQSGSDGVELYFPGSQFGLSTSVTSFDFINGVPFERDGYIYTYTNFLGQLTIKAEPTEATIAFRKDLEAYVATIDEVNKTIDELWIKPNDETVNRKFKYSGDDPSPSEATTTFSKGDSPTAQEQDFPASRLLKYYDTQNYHPYDKLEISEGADGKVATAQVTLDPAALAAGMTIGQIFGSALGGALGGNSLVGNLASSTIGGLIGQKFVQVLATSMTTDLSRISLNDVFSSQGISVANAGIGAVSSFLTAELGHALHIDGFSGQLFNTAVSGFTTSLLTQVTDKMVRGGLDFAGAIAAIDWTQAVTGAIDVAQINLGNLLGSYLGHELVPAQTREGAIGGQIFGAIGSFILPGGLGSLIGTILGTWIGNQLGTQPSPGAVDLLDQAGYFYGHSQYQSSDGGGYEISNKMAQAADDIINAYLHAVDGAALDHSKQATIGYIKNPDLLFIHGVPNRTDHSFGSADDAVHAVALDVLQNLEVIGGDLLMKRAHQNSNRLQLNRGATARRRVRAGGWRLAQRPSASIPCIRKRFA